MQVCGNPERLCGAPDSQRGMGVPWESLRLRFLMAPGPYGRLREAPQETVAPSRHPVIRAMVVKRRRAIPVLREELPHAPQHRVHKLDELDLAVL